MVIRVIVTSENETCNWESNNTTIKPLLNSSLEELVEDSNDASP